jgi:hypothetical protein
MKCLSCQSETENPKFCSRSCAASYTNKVSPKRKLKKKCSHEDCECIVRNYRSILCENHYQERFKNKKEIILQTTVGEYRERNKLHHRSSIHAHIRGFARNWFKDLIKKPCAACGYDKHVELCHIKPMSSFSDDSLVGEVNHKDNIVQLCPNCHWEFDNGLLKEW